jgi:hypothetical protein
VIHEIRETPGDWLFHYTTLETALVFILPHLRLRLSPFSRMRDPREYKRWFPGAAGYMDERWLEAELMRRWAQASERLNLLRDEFKLLSLTTDSPDAGEGVYGRGFARSRLWESYASNGTGVCLVLKKPDAVKLIPAQLEGIGKMDHGPIRYANSPVHTEIMFNFEEIFGDLDAVADRIATKHLEKLFLTKNREWESEREYRFVVRSQNEWEYVGITDSLVAVVQGPESAPDAEHSLRHFATERQLALGLVQWNGNDPKLIGRPLTPR